MFRYKNLSLTWFGYDGFKIEVQGEMLVIDPFMLEDEAKADYLLLTHEHAGHCDEAGLELVIKPSSTIVVATPPCRSHLAEVLRTSQARIPKEVEYVKPGDQVKLGSFDVKAVPAYNTNKRNQMGMLYHPKEENQVGYLIKTSSGVTIYHAGDSDLIPEMSDLRPDIALIPVSGTSVMTADEAVQAVDAIKPRIAIPMHYGTIMGSIEDAEKFKKGARAEVHLLQNEGWKGSSRGVQC